VLRTNPATAADSLVRIAADQIKASFGSAS